MEALKDFAPGGWWAPNPRALRRKSGVAPCSFCPQVSLLQDKRHLPEHLYPLPLSLTGFPAREPCAGTLCSVPQALEKEAQGAERPSPNSLQCRGTGHPLPTPMVVSSSAPSLPPPLLGCFLPVTCPSLSSSQVTPPPGSPPPLLPKPLFTTSSSKQPGTPSPPATLAHSLPRFPPQISSLSHLRASESPVSSSPTSRSYRRIFLRFSVNLS